MKRYLIINADDFGQSPGIVTGVARAHDEGVVTSASLMVRGPAAATAARAARHRPELSVGLHFDLGEWSYLDGEWHPRYEVVPLHDQRAVRAELGRQLEAFRQLLGRDPTHLDSHQHVHRTDPVRAVVQEAAKGLCVPLRDLTDDITYRGDFYGQGEREEPHPELLTLEAFERIVTGIGPGITELGCHPGLVADVESSYAHERLREVEVLCAPRAFEVIERAGVERISFHDLARVRAATEVT